MMMAVFDFLLEVVGAIFLIFIAGGAVVFSLLSGDESIDTDSPHEAPFGNPTSDYRITEVSEVTPGDEVFHPRYFDNESGEHRFL